MKLNVRNQTLRQIVVFVVVLIASGLLVYGLLRVATTNQPAQTRAVAGPPAETARPVDQATRDQQRPVNDDDRSVLSKLFESKNVETSYESEGWGTAIVRITLRLLLAAALAAALAFRPRKKSTVLRRNPYVAQTQILLGIVASALMMIVGDNAARAFGIFAAVSLVRFRTNIRDPKEIAVLLISLAIGLATGVGRPDLAVILCAFVLIALWILEHFEAREVSRAMELKVETKNIESTEQAVKDVLDKYHFASELRALSRSDGEQAGTLVESVDVSPDVSTDKLSEEILSHDSENIMGIQWEQKKAFSYLYQ